MIIWSFGILTACRMTLGSKHTSFPKLKNQTSPKVWPWKRQLARRVFGEKNSIRGGTRFAIIPFKRPIPCDYLQLWKFDRLQDDSGVKTQFVPLIEKSDLSQSVPMEASTRKEHFERKKLHLRRYSFCNVPLQTCGEPVIIWSFGNLIACTMTMGSKHTLFPKLKNQTSPKVCPWKRQLARSDLRGKNSIRGGTHFAIIPFKRPEDR